MPKNQTPHNKWISYKIPPDWDGKKVEEVLKGPLALSRRMINRLTRSRGIRLNGRMPWLERRVKEGDHLRVAVRPLERSDLIPEPVPFGLLYEDEDLMVVNKPAGVNVHPVHPKETGTLIHGILDYWQGQGFEGRVRPVHRLDRDTTGVLLIAKNAYMHQLLDRQLKSRTIERIYLAIISGRLPQGVATIRLPIGRDPTHPVRRRVAKGGVDAITQYRVVAATEEASLVEARLKTGRTHQIRTHFAHLGHPLWGDSLYGGPREQIGRHALHAGRLSFTHPLKERDDDPFRTYAAGFCPVEDNAGTVRGKSDQRGRGAPGYVPAGPAFHRPPFVGKGRRSCHFQQRFPAGDSGVNPDAFRFQSNGFQRSFQQIHSDKSPLIIEGITPKRGERARNASASS